MCSWPALILPLSWFILRPVCSIAAMLFEQGSTNRQATARSQHGTHLPSTVLSDFPLHTLIGSLGHLHYVFSPPPLSRHVSTFVFTSTSSSPINLLHLHRSTPPLSVCRFDIDLQGRVEFVACMYLLNITLCRGLMNPFNIQKSRKVSQYSSSSRSRSQHQ